MANRADATSGGGFSDEQLQNARIIAQVGRSMGMSSRDIQIALMTALQESGLRNLHYGDRDSQGLFQQRPSQGWGTVAQVTDPVYASKKFFQRLSQIDNRNSMELWQAAQKVQVSAFPRAYAKWEGEARNLMSQFGTSVSLPSGPQAGSFDMLPDLMRNVMIAPQVEEQPPVTAAPQGVAAQSPVDNPLNSAMDKILQDGIGGDGVQNGAESPQALGTQAADEAIDWSKWTPQDALMQDASGVAGGLLDNAGLAGGQASGLRSAVLEYAKKFIGRPYVWGATGPSGFDCSGLIQYALGQMGVSVPRLAYQQANFGKQTSIGNIQPGDLVFWGNSRRTQGNHIAFYLGNNTILEAPRPGLSVRIRQLGEWDKDDGAVGVKLDY